MNAVQHEKDHRLSYRMRNEKQQTLTSIIFIHSLVYVYILVTTNVSNLYLRTITVLVNILSFRNVTLVDPGYICKKHKNYNYENSTLFYNGTSSTVSYTGEKWQTIIRIGSQEAILNYCEECNIFKLQNTSHCRECDRCIIEIDHHCYWLGICIGRNNITYFYIYISSIAAILGFVIDSWSDVAKDNIFGFYTHTLFMIGCCMLYFAYYSSCLFLFYYIYLAVTNLRSREVIKNISRYKKPDLCNIVSRIFRDRREISCDACH